MTGLEIYIYTYLIFNIDILLVPIVSNISNTNLLECGIISANVKTISERNPQIT